MLTVVISWLFSEAGYVLLNKKYDMIISQKDKGEPSGSVLFVFVRYLTCRGPLAATFQKGAAAVTWYVHVLLILLEEEVRHARRQNIC